MKPPPRPPFLSVLKISLAKSVFVVYLKQDIGKRWQSQAFPLAENSSPLAFNIRPDNVHIGQCRFTASDFTASRRFLVNRVVNYAGVIPVFSHRQHIMPATRTKIVRPFRFLFQNFFYFFRFLWNIVIYFPQLSLIVIDIILNISSFKVCPMDIVFL